VSFKALKSKSEIYPQALKIVPLRHCGFDLFYAEGEEGNGEK